MCTALVLFSFLWWYYCFGLFYFIVRYIFYLLEDGIYRASLPTSSDLITAALLVVRIRAPKDFVINYQSKRLIFFYKERQSFVSCFLDGSGFNELRPKVSFADIESFVYENNTLVVTNGRAVFHEEMSANGISSFNEYVADCSLTDPDYFGYGNLLFYGSSAQPFPLPSPPQFVTALFGSDQAVVTWKPPEPTIGTSKFNQVHVALYFPEKIFLIFVVLTASH